MRKIAVVGSRGWPDLDQVEDKLVGLHARHGAKFIIVSGGARGVDTKAEQTWLTLGGPVISLRPVQFEQRADRLPEFRVHEWRIFKTDPVVIEHEPSWADFASCAHYRNLLIAERCDEALVFWDGHSRGTWHAIDSLKAAGKKATVIRP